MKPKIGRINVLLGLGYGTTKGGGNGVIINR
jgi:hypothetical protein